MLASFSPITPIAEPQTLLHTHHHQTLPLKYHFYNVPSLLKKPPDPTYLFMPLGTSLIRPCLTQIKVTYARIDRVLVLT